MYIVNGTSGLYMKVLVPVSKSPIVRMSIHSKIFLGVIVLVLIDATPRCNESWKQEIRELILGVDTFSTRIIALKVGSREYHIVTSVFKSVPDVQS